MQVPAAFFALLLVAVSIPITAGLLFFIGQLQKTRPILPYEPRRPAPWNGIDVLMFLGIMFLAEIACLKIGMLGSGTHFPDEGTALDSQQQYLLVTAHFVGSLMTLILGVAMLSVRVAATPIDLGWNAAQDSLRSEMRRHRLRGHGAGSVRVAAFVDESGTLRTPGD